MKRRNSGKSRKRFHILLIGVLCLAIGAAFLVTSAIQSNRPMPPVVVLLNESRIRGKGDAFYDFLVIQNHSSENVTVVVVIKTPLDNSERVSAPVTVCGGCKTIVEIREIQPLPDQNMDYYTNAIENPDYAYAEYPPTFSIALRISRCHWVSAQ